MAWKQYPEAEMRGDENGNIESLIGNVWYQVSSGGATDVNQANLLSGEDQTNNVLVIEQGQFDYEAVAASQTDQLLGATGAVGDFLHKVVCVVATAATSEVLIQDGDGTEITVLPNNVGAGIGTYTVELNIVCINATTPGWKVTTAAGVSVIGIGRFV